ncbi:YciI family protein [Jongsikchunia kroppenstedtii]|uniref:YciI family protein n=1 Tax=Jongsikchunia kroppenstedtii TaxID=1121721 RepID=UPI000375E478|nr:YciI family protein [Jongsikchunia kroppenstedtii]
MPLFAVEYTYAPGPPPSLREIRPQHRAWLGALYEAGTVRTSGPYPDDSGALIIVEAESVAAVQDLLTHDPLRESDAISDVRINEWVCVFEWRS